MTESTQGSGAANPQDGVTEETQTQSNSEQAQTPPEKTVRWEDHKRAIDDMHKFKKELQLERQKLEEMQTAKLKEKDDYKTLYENEKKLRESKEEAEASLRESIDLTAKHNAVQAAAIKAGLRPDAMELLEALPLDGVEIEKTSTGRFMVHGADTYIELLKKKMPFAFQNGQVPKFNSGGSSGGMEIGDVTVSSLLAAEKEMKMKPNDMSLRKKYQEMSKKFLESRTKK